MLQSLKIKNFKCIGDEQTLDNLGSINILTGQNNSGKSAILEALWIMGEVLPIKEQHIPANFHGGNAPHFGNYLDKVNNINPRQKVIDFLYNRNSSENIEIELAFKTNNNKLEQYFESIIRQTSKSKILSEIKDLNSLKICFEFLNNGQDIYIKALYWGNLKLNNNSKQLFNVPHYLHTDDQKVQYNDSFDSSFYKSTLLPIYHSFLKQFTSVYIHSKRRIETNATVVITNPDIKGSYLKRELFRLFHGDLNEKKKYDKILDLFKKITGRPVYDIPTFNKDDNSIEIVFKEGNTLIPIDGSGYGYSQILNIIFNMIMYDANIVLIDEPEISLHPQAQIELFEAIKTISTTENKQFFLATHSPYFIDLSRANNIYKIAKEKNNPAKIFQIKNEEFIKKICDKNDRIVNFRFRELLFMEEVIFVEGFDDLDFYLEFIENKEILIKNAIEKFYEMGGYHKGRLEILTNLCNEFNIKCVFICDLDYFLYEPQIAKFLSILLTFKDKNIVQASEACKRNLNRDARKELKKQINDYCSKNLVEFWNHNSIREVIRETEGKNIFIVPFCSVLTLKMEIKNPEIENILINMFEKIRKIISN